MFKDIVSYLDSNGLVTQNQSLGGDGGDSLNRSCSLYILTKLTKQPQFPLSRVVINCSSNTHLGKFRRSNQFPKWYSYFDRTSRDQLTPLVIALGLSILWKIQLRNVFRDHLKRGLLFAYNTRRNFQYPTLEEHQRLSTPDVKWDYSWKLPDITGPEFWALYIRGFQNHWLYPLLWIFDVFSLLGAITIRLNNDNDVLNHALILEYGKIRMDSLAMKVARMITPRSFLQTRLDSFFSREIEPPLNEIYLMLPR